MLQINKLATMKRAIFGMGLLLSLISLLLVAATDGRPIENLATTKDTIVANYASKAIVYWQRVIPNTPIPLAILDLVTPPPTEGDEKEFPRLKDEPQSIDVDDDSRMFYYTNYGATKDGNNEKRKSTEGDKNKVDPRTKRDAEEYICDQPESTTNGQGGGLEHISVSYNGEHHVPRNSRGVFFFEDQLIPGSLLTTLVPRTTPRRRTLLNREIADSIPFSSKNFTEIVAMFAPASLAMTKNIKFTLDACEDPSRVKGEKRGCATSLESMVDLATSILGTRDVRAISPDVPMEGLPSRQYSLAAVRRASDSLKIMTCHDMAYPYMVYFCHMIVPSRAYLVTLASDDGSPPTEALAMCHLDTSSWNPNHVFFKRTGVKPGETTACHFANRGSVVWAPVGDQGLVQVAAE